MCTLVLLRRPGDDWPLLLAANRDEMTTRAWRAPDRHWPDRLDVVAGLDETAGGSWLGMNDHGLAAAVLNREGSLGPKTGKRSRGELVLEALDHADAASAAEALCHLDPNSYRSFNLVVADNTEAYWLRHTGGREKVSASAIPSGLTMVTAFDLNDARSARTRRHLPALRQAAAPDPDLGEWDDWIAILSSRRRERQRGRP